MQACAQAMRLPCQYRQHLMKIKQPYNINTAAHESIIESSRHQAPASTVKAMVKERDKLYTGLKKLKWLTHILRWPTSSYARA